MGKGFKTSLHVLQKKNSQEYIASAKFDVLKRIVDLKNDQKTSEISMLYTPIAGRFISCNDGFRDNIQVIKNEIINYQTTSYRKQKRPLNILIGAFSGSGKSFLINELATDLQSNNIDSSFLEFQISAFKTIKNLDDLFRKIQSENLNGKLPLVLIDEVDAKIQNKPIYGKLLAPMWNGEYFEGINKHNLGKAVLFFAGSSIFTSPEIEVYNEVNGQFLYKQYKDSWIENTILPSGIEKLSDFIDRIDHTIIPTAIIQSVV